MIDYIRSQIKKRRAEKGFTQSDVAIDLRITPGAYNKIESGPTAITIERLAEIAAILEVDIAYFFKGAHITTKAEDAGRPYGYATKTEMDELFREIEKLKKEISSLKSSLPRPVAKKKKKP